MSNKYLIAVVSEIKTSTESIHLRAAACVGDSGSRYFTLVEADSLADAVDKHANLRLSLKKSIKPTEILSTNDQETIFKFDPLIFDDVKVACHLMGQIGDTIVCGLEAKSGMFYIDSIAGRHTRVVHSVDVIEQSNESEDRATSFLIGWLHRENDRRFDIKQPDYYGLE